MAVSTGARRRPRPARDARAADHGGGRVRANRLNHDTNSHAHQRASVVGPSETVPILYGRLALGTWRQLALLDFDDRPRERTVVLQLFS